MEIKALTIAWKPQQAALDNYSHAVPNTPEIRVVQQRFSLIAVEEQLLRTATNTTRHISGRQIVELHEQ